MKAEFIKTSLRSRHGEWGPSPPWVCVDEALSGWSNWMTGGIDLIAFGIWSSATAPGLQRAGRAEFRYPVVAYEVKVSRSDFRRELKKWPAKAQVALDVSNYFVFAVPRGLLDPEELAQREPWPLGGPRLWVPPGVGLVEVDDSGWCKATIPAQPRVRRELKKGEVHEILRHATKPLRDERWPTWRERALAAEKRAWALEDTVSELLETYER